MMDIDSLRLMVTNKSKKLKQIHIVWLCLNFVESNPEEAPNIGCFWNTNSSFLINTEIFGLFIDRLPNTINRSFRSHKFNWKKSSALLRGQVPKKFDIKNFPDPQNWIQRKCEGFTKNTTEIEAINWKYYHLTPKKSKINKDVIQIQDNFVNSENTYLINTDLSNCEIEPEKKDEKNDQPLLIEDQYSIFEQNINSFNDYFNDEQYEMLDFSFDFGAHDEIYGHFGI